MEIALARTEEQSNLVGEGITADRGRWSFDGISRVFDDHVRRSVPLYNEGHDLTCRLSDYFVASNSLVYDLGTATGSLARKLADWHQGKAGTQVIGIDPVQSMVEQAEKVHGFREDLRFICSDALTYEFEKANLFTSYYTVQFVHPNVRQQLIDRIYERLHWGGAFILFEKVRAPDARFQDYMSQVYTDFKLANGYDEKEVVGKTRSLKGVLEPFSTNGNIEMLQRAGFKDIMTVQKWVCFEGFLAIK
ncbi:methyltransferase domain-containing protein [Rubellimicrobium rubrum]|uniref:Methyltransferase domain-containing protein n=1 Tax=Rubellimicrobium rubrum TaxID=2585369 RepID=A0A5C4MJJ5_9RHOB|nr:methyltransferase domain-containing protein [Rubellimicrobium rubrum]TNC45394.1 methyltransferase domain-containing protein [Rubellimicrobium rubrum]